MGAEGERIQTHFLGRENLMRYLVKYYAAKAMLTWHLFHLLALFYTKKVPWQCRKWSKKARDISAYLEETPCFTLYTGRVLNRLLFFSSASMKEVKGAVLPSISKGVEGMTRASWSIFTQ